MRGSIFRKVFKLHFSIYLFSFLALVPAFAVADDQFEITGVSKEVEENIRLHLGTSERDLGAMDLNQAQQLLQPPLKQAMQAYGYYQYEFVSSQNQGKLILKIVPGSRVLWNKFELVLNENQHQQQDELMQKLMGSTGHPFKAGEGINHAEYDGFKRDLIARAQSMGYMDARYARSRLEINPTNLTADVYFTVELGERYHVSQINFDGSELDQELLYIIAAVDIGNIYSADDIGRIYNRLASSGYFSIVEIETERMSANAVKLNVHLTDRPKHRFSTGVGFVTDTGPRFKLK